MKIVSVPHPSLRSTATRVKRLDNKLDKFLTSLGQTLANKDNPQGVGLAAPQVDKNWRIFATYLPDPDFPDSGELIQTYINPVITKHCQHHKTLGPDPKKPVLEGCLSIPQLYGPVPRYRWVEIEFQRLENDQLVNYKQTFSDFPGRVIQHELDHLDGILFTDYSLEYDLPVYESQGRDKLVELNNRSILETF